MEEFEQNIPIAALVAGFLVLMVVSRLLQNWLRKRHLLRQGQIETSDNRIPSIEERVAANACWASGKIRSEGRGLMLALLTLAVVWNLTFGVSFVDALSNPKMAIGARIALGVFALLGIVPIYFAARATIQHFRYGHSWCCITGKAGLLGDTMAGIIRTTSEIRPSGDYQIELQCVESYSTGTGKDRRTENRVHYHEKVVVPPGGKNSRLGIPFSFNLPKYPPETGYQLARGRIQWGLKISAPVEGVDYMAMFVVPVFKLDQGEGV